MLNDKVSERIKASMKKPVIVEEVNFVSALFPEIEIHFIYTNPRCHAKD